MRLWLWLAIGIGALLVFLRVPLTPGAVFSPSPAQAAERQAAYLSEAFLASKAHPTGFEVHDWTQVNRQFMTVRQLSILAKKLQQELRVRNAKVTQKAVGKETYVAVRGLATDGGTVAIFLSSFQGQQGSGQTVLVIREDVSHLHPHDVHKNLSNDLETVAKATAELHLSSQISACIQGYVGDRMEDGQQDKLAARVMQAVHAQRVEGIKTGLLTSISAYSPLGSTFITGNGHKMNLQIAVHYDDYHQRTNVVIGTPIITVTY
jgi:hypothetical protein